MNGVQVLYWHRKGTKCRKLRKYLHQKYSIKWMWNEGQRRDWVRSHKKMDKQEAAITLPLFIQYEGTQGVPGGREKQIVAIVAQWDIQDHISYLFVPGKKCQKFLLPLLPYNTTFAYMWFTVSSWGTYFSLPKTGTFALVPQRIGCDSLLQAAWIPWSN